MSRVKISSNLFIELAEIKKIEKFLIDESGYKTLFQITNDKYGLVKIENTENPLYNIAKDSFKVRQKTGYNDTVVVETGLAIDYQYNLITKLMKTDIQISNDGFKKWLVIEYDTHNFENGTISITATGQVTGIGTEFTKVLRGYNNFPNKIKVESSNQMFEVVDVISDTQAFVKINGAGAFNNERYSVSGTFTPGFIPNVNDVLIYEYDFYKISVINSPTPPILNSGQYLLASVEYDANNDLLITDERTEYFGNMNLVEQKSNMFLSLVTTAVVNHPVKLNNVILNKTFDIELNFQFSCNIIQSNIVDSYHKLTVSQIDCNALGNSMPNIVDFFKNCWLFNRENGKKTLITGSNNNSLNFDTDSDFWTLNDDLCILPPEFGDFIELEVKNYGSPNVDYVDNSGLNEDISTYTFDILSKNAKIVVPILSSDDVNTNYDVVVKYKMIGDNISYQKFTPIPQIAFQNYLKITETITATGSFSVNPSLILNSIVENYS